MLILNQWKSEIINLDRTKVISADEIKYEGKNGVGIFAGIERFPLGRYKDQTRAREVLREIMMEYRIPGKMVYEMPEV